MGAGPMKFQKGHKLAKGGKRNPPGGRPSTRELKEIARAADRAREKLQRKFEAITDCYTDLATDREHEATTRHAMENYVLPVAKEEGEALHCKSPSSSSVATPHNRDKILPNLGQVRPKLSHPFCLATIGTGMKRAVKVWHR